MGIISKPTLLTSPDNAIGIETILTDYCATLGPNCVRKKESELTESDFGTTLFLVGELNGFKKWNLYRSPISKTGKGFLINGKAFLAKSDGFVFIDTNRIIISGNSLKAVKDAQLALTGGHDILITQNGKITYFGNRKGQTFEWFNLQNLKNTNYTRKASDLFSAIYISKSFRDTINYSSLNKSLRSYATQFLNIYKIKMPVTKVTWFVHSNVQELGTMSGLFGLTCPGNNSAGFSIRGEIHTNRYDVELMKHEYSHYLFDHSIPQDNNPAFFVEGSVEYVATINDASYLRQRMEIAKQYKDSLNYSDLIINNRDFYGQYSSVNYSVCGIFVKYLIDKFGVETFKKYCLTGNKKARTKDILNIDFDELVDGYKGWLDKQ